MRRSTESARRPAALGGDSLPILIDAGFFIALHSREDPHHHRATEVAQEISEGRFGQPVISDYLVAEVLNFASRRMRSTRNVGRMLDELLGRTDEAWLDLVKIDLEMFEASVRLYESFGVEKGLSFTDCSSIVLARALKISSIASFDAGFDGFLQRLS